MMTKTTKAPSAKPPKPLDVDVKNPRYKGATIEIVARALLRRPKKGDQGDAREPQDDA